ncbi:hypothetical protein P3547_19760 [Vibrio parahaemolyticus]|nr:hypothetical protein [Vibrio parahaemolyticus]
MNTENKQVKAKHTAPHIPHNVNFELEDKQEVMLTTGTIAKKLLEQDAQAKVIEAVESIADVVDFYSTIKTIELVVVTSKDKLSETIQEQKSTFKRDVICIESGERLSFKDSIKLNARMLVLTNENTYKNALAFAIQSTINIKTSEARLAKMLAELGMAEPLIKDVMSRKNWKLEKAVKKNLFLPKLNNILNINNISEMSKSVAMAIKAKTGAGKNVALMDPAIKEAIEAGKKVVFITSRKSIINKNTKTHEGTGAGFTSYEAGPAIINAMNPQAFAVCINSLANKVNLEEALSAYLVVVDEGESCIRDMLMGNDSESSKNRMSKKARKLIISAFARVLKSAPNLIFADADISPLTVEFLLSVRPDIQIFNMEQDYSDITASVATKEMVLMEAECAIKANTQPVVVMFDKLKDLNAFLKGLRLNDETALKDGILVLSSDTSERKEQQEFIVNPDAVLAQTQYRAILCTPTLGRGVSITHHYTDKVFIIANGVLDPASMIQLPRRFRTATEFVFGVNTDYKIAVDYVANLSTAEASEDAEFDLMLAKYKTEHELLTSNIAITLHEALRALKFTMVEHASLDASEDEMKEAKSKASKNRKAAKKEHIESILAAQDKTESEVKVLENKKAKTRQERFELERHIIQKKTGIKDIAKADIDFCNKFSLSVYNLLTSAKQVSPLVYNAFEKVTINKFGHREIAVNKSIAVDIIKDLQVNSNSVNEYLPENQRISSKMRPCDAQKIVKELLEMAGFRSKRSSRVIDGEKVSVNVFTLSPLAVKNAEYFKNN